MSTLDIKLENVLKEISLIEADFLQMGIASKLKSSRTYQTEIKEEIQNILNAVKF